MGGSKSSTRMYPISGKTNPFDSFAQTPTVRRRRRRNKKPIHYAPFFDQPFEPLHKLVHSLSSLHTCLPPLDLTSTRQQILPLHHDALSESGRFVRRGEEIGLVEEDDRRGWVDEWLEQGKGCTKRIDGPRVEKGGEGKNEDLKGRRQDPKKKEIKEHDQERSDTIINSQTRN